ncbi:MAG: SRPBCC family protein [Geminicoccaceae bacterium]
MAKVEASGTIPATIGDVWAVVGDFGKIADWLPPLASSGLAHGATGNQVGDVRQCMIDGGPTLSETQTARSDADHTYSYAIPEGPLPMKNYQSTIKLVPAGQETVLEWTSTFEPDPGQEDELPAMIKSVYQAGIDHLKQHFGG